MTKKNLNTQAVINELRGQSVFFRNSLQSTTPPEKPGSKTKRDNAKPSTIRSRTTSRAADRSISPSTKGSVDQSTGQSTDPLTDIDFLGPIVERPRAFYITQLVDRWLDEGVRYLKEKGLHKADRSVLVNALLHDPDLFQPGCLDQLKNRLLAHLTNRSLKRTS